MRKLPPEISILRRATCVNALQGIKDPAAAILAVKEVLNSLIAKMEAAGWPESDVDEARRTLALLEGAE